MLAAWRHARANVAFAGASLACLLLALKSSASAGLGLAALAGAVSLYAWQGNLRRYSAIADTPTSRIASAPQGYVELAGKGMHPPGSRLVSPISGLPCLWYRYLIEERNGNKWRRMDSGESVAPFGIKDDSGMALIDPEDAEVVASAPQVMIKGSYRHTEWTLIEGQTLYVLGEHVTLGSANSELDSHRDVSDLLAEWKRDQAALLTRFDINEDGIISIREWEEARNSAHREIEARHQAIRLESGTALLKKARGRLFLIANRSPGELTARYRFWAWVHLGLFMLACLTAAGLQ